MKKNLKKVISAVLALALAMSSFVVMTTSAATFADVADTANYAEAVNALAALGAIAGTGDGTFKPDDNITRAEAATMVVAALNLSADAKNAGSTSQFADVNEQAKWAIGYVNVGVAQNYISGTSATTFNPLDNVTYVQLLTMLTRILGYGDFAESRGGYPNGYLTAASTAGILTGVTAGAEEPITRAQAAQLIWNAVQAPMLDITTFTGSVADTELKKMDGSAAAGGKFKTVLSDKYDAYVLDVIVDETSKQGQLEIGTISMTLTSSTQWDPELEYKGSKDTKNEVAVGKTDAEEYVFASAKVVAEYNDDDEWTLLYFAPTGKVSTKTIDGSLINDQSGTYLGVDISTTTTTPSPSASPVTSSTGVLRIKKSATSSASSATEYNLQDANLYVNGVFFCAVDSTNAAAVQAMLKASTGDVTLVQNDNLPGRVYNRIMMDYYVVASVNQVKTSSKETELRITGAATIPTAANSIASAPGTSLTVDADELAEGELIVNVTKAGAAADLSAIAKNDVVALKYNIKKPLSDFGTSFNRIDILATTDVVSGKYNSYDTDADLYNIGGVNYEAAKNQSVTMGNTYTFRLDPFGRLFDGEEEATTINYAIVERYVDIAANPSTNAEYDFLDVVTLDGQSKRLYVDNASTTRTAVRTEMATATIGSVVSANAALPLENRIIEYKVKTSTGRLNFVDVTANAEPFGPAQYNASTNRLHKALAETVVVLDATKYDTANPSASDYKASSLAALTANVDYHGVLVHKNSNNQWGYLVIEEAGATYSTTTDFAVVAEKGAASSANSAIVDDEEVYTLTVMQNGDNEATKLNVSLNAEIYVNGANDSAPDKTYANNCATYLREGAVFFYTTDSYGLVDRIDVILQGGYNYNTIAALVTEEYGSTAANIANLVKLPYSPVGTNIIKASEWAIDIDDKDVTGVQDELIQLFIAPVMTAGTNNITFGAMETASRTEATAGADGILGTPDDGTQTVTGIAVNTNADFTFSISDDAKIYDYDLGEVGTGANAFRGGAFVGFDATDAEANGYAWMTNVPTAGTNFNGMVQYAFVMAVDGMITNALLLNA